MAFGISKPRCSPIAIDFGADRLKVMQIVPSDPPQLVAAAAATIPGDVRSDTAGRMAFLGDALKRLLKAQPFRGRRVICSIPAFQTLIQHVEVPRVDGSDLTQQIGLHMLERFSADPNKLVIRPIEVAQHQRNGTPVQEVVVQAASRDIVMGYIKLAETAKLEVVGMHPEPTAIIKCFEHTFSRREEDHRRVACYIDIGSATTKVVIAEGFRVAFAKSIQVGAGHVIQAIADQAGLSFDEARQAQQDAVADTLPAMQPAGPSSDSPTGRERRVNVIEHRTTGLAALDATVQTADAAAAPGPDPEAEMVDAITDELRLSLRHYHAVCPDKPVERLVFLGGHARQTGVCQAIAKAVRTAAQLGDPFARLVRIGAAKAATGVNLNEPQPGWAVPFGLCYCEANL